MIGKKIGEIKGWEFYRDREGSSHRPCG